MSCLLLTVIATAILQTVTSSRLNTPARQSPTSVLEPARKSALEPAWKAVLLKERSFWSDASETWSWATSEGGWTDGDLRREATQARPSRALVLEHAAKAMPVAEAAGTLAAWNAAADTFTAALDEFREAQKKLIAADAAAKVKRKDKKTKNAAEAAKKEAMEWEETVTAAELALRIATKAAAKFHPEAAVQAAKDAEFEALEARVEMKAARAASAKESLEHLLRQPAIDQRKMKITIE